MTLRTSAAAVVLAAAGVLAFSTSHDREQRRAQRTAATVTEVLDGDTVRARDDTGHPLGRVRLLGIDAPEIAHHNRPGQCWGQEAKQQLLDLAPVGTKVKLVGDDGQPDVDVYGRLLRYLDTPQGDVSTLLLKAGAAEVHDSRPDLARAGAHEAAQHSAQTNRSGMWGACP